MSWYQCSTCGELFASAGDLAAHKREAHLHVPQVRQSARRRVLVAVLALSSAIALADCDAPAPAWAECFPSFQAPTPCVGHEAETIPPASTAISDVVVVDVTPPAVMPVSVSVPASPVPDVTPPTSAAIGEATFAPAELLPATGGSSLVLALVALGFVLVGATFVGPLRTKGRRS